MSAFPCHDMAAMMDSSWADRRMSHNNRGLSTRTGSGPFHPIRTHPTPLQLTTLFMPAPAAPTRPAAAVSRRPPRVSVSPVGRGGGRRGAGGGERVRPDRPPDTSPGPPSSLKSVQYPSDGGNEQSLRPTAASFQTHRLRRGYRVASRPTCVCCVACRTLALAASAAGPVPASLLSGLYRVALHRLSHRVRVVVLCLCCVLDAKFFAAGMGRGLRGRRACEPSIPATWPARR